GLGGDDPGRFPVPAVHPHVRGARESVPVRAPSLVGPSPRAWGSAQELVQYVAADRSIPTCVGLGPRWSYIPSLPPVHPHVRGARTCPGSPADTLSGPSPRAWGSALVFDWSVPRTRSIPTCVGLGGLACSPTSQPPVHPHVRGARPIHHLTGDPVNGPSPRAWGSGVLRLQITA